MPTLPVYNAQNNIRPTTGEPLRNEAGAPFEMAREVVSTMQTVAQKWSDANDVMQYTEAKAKYELAVADIEMRANADPDFRKAPDYLAELAKAKETALSTVTSPQVTNKASFEFDYGNQLSGMKIGGQFRKKQMVNNLANLSTAMASLQAKRFTTDNPNERNATELEIDRLRASNLYSGLVSKSEMDEIDGKALFKAVESAVYANPDISLVKLNKEDFGLDPKSHNKLITEAQQIIKKREDLAEWQKNQTLTQGAISLSVALGNNSLTSKMVRDMQQAGTIDAETAAIFDAVALKKKYEIPANTSLAEPDYYIRLLEDSMGDWKDIKKIMADAARAYGDHKIGTNQYLYFINSASETFDRQNRGIFTSSKEQAGVKFSIEGIKNAATSIYGAGKNATKEVSEATGEMVTKFFDRFKPGDDPQKVKAEVIEESLNIQIEKAKKEPKPEMVRMIHPDGRRVLVPSGQVNKALKNGYRNAR